MRTRQVRRREPNPPSRRWKLHMYRLTQAPLRGESPRHCPRVTGDRVYSETSHIAARGSTPFGIRFRGGTVPLQGERGSAFPSVSQARSSPFEGSPNAGKKSFCQRNIRVNNIGVGTADGTRLLLLPLLLPLPLPLPLLLILILLLVLLLLRLRRPHGSGARDYVITVIVIEIASTTWIACQGLCRYY